MALTTLGVLGPTLNDKPRYVFQSGAVTFEFTGVTSGEAGWLKHSETGQWRFDFDAQEAGGDSQISWLYFYYHTPRSMSLSSYKAVIAPRYTRNDFSTCIANLQFIRTGAGTLRFQLAEDTTTARDTGAVFALDTTYYICYKMNITSGAVEVFINGTSDLAYTYANVFAGGFAASLQSGDSSESVAAWWSSFVTRTDATDTEDETLKSECRQHLPTANGTYDDYSSHVNNTNGSADYTYWNEAVQDDATTWNQGEDSVTYRQSSQIQARTYSNTVRGLLWLGYLWADFSSKNPPHSALLRQSGTDETLTLPAANSTSRDMFAAVFSGDYDLDGTPVMEAGHKREPTPGDDANIRITALLVEGGALGATNEAPPDPPAARSLVVPHPTRRLAGMMGG